MKEEVYLKGGRCSDPKMLAYFDKLIAKTKQVFESPLQKSRFVIIRRKFDEIQALRKSNPDFDRWVKYFLSFYQAELVPMDLMDGNEDQSTLTKTPCEDYWYLEMSNFDSCEKNRKESQYECDVLPYIC